MNIDKALKIIPEAIVSDEEAMADLQAEARTMISLNHNSIVRVYDFHDAGAVKYIDMEFVEGKTLTKLKLEHPNKQVPEAEVKALAIKIADGLAYAHSKGVIHKDIKPQNVMLNKDGEVKIMDFGIAETVRTSMSRIQNSSSSGTLVYMSPEQIKGKDVGKESDIYSFGAMLYELLSGHPPFYKGDINYQILNETPEPLINISENLNELIMKCLEKDYDKRFRGFDEIKYYFNNFDFEITKNQVDLEDNENSNYTVKECSALSQDFTKELKGWNWGAFLLTFFWSTSYKKWLGILAIIPYFGIIISIIFGIKGNKWAWENKQWYSFENFKKAQRKWAIWGICIWVFYFIIIFIGM